MNLEEKNKILENVRGESDPDTSVGSVDEISLSNFIIGLSLAIFLACVLIFANLKAKDAQISTLNSSIEQNVTRPLADLEKESAQIDTVKQQLTVLSNVLSSRHEYSKLIKELSTKQLKKSKWINLNIQESEIAISGVTDYYEDLAKAISALKTSPYIQDVKLTQATVNEDTKKVEFGLVISIDKKLLKKTTKSVAETEVKQ